MELTPVEPGPGQPADVKLFVNGQETGSGRVARTVPFRYSVEPFDVGRDTVSPVTEDYQVPFAFQGRIEHVTVEVP
jgi:arylsulfatase